MSTATSSQVMSPFYGTKSPQAMLPCYGVMSLPATSTSNISPRYVAIYRAMSPPTMSASNVSPSNVAILWHKFSPSNVYQQCLSKQHCHFMVQHLPLQSLPLTSSPVMLLSRGTTSPPSTLPGAMFSSIYISNCDIAISWDDISPCYICHQYVPIPCPPCCHCFLFCFDCRNNFLGE